HFVVWGFVHGLALCVHKLLLSIIPSWKQEGRSMKPYNRFFSTILTFHFICLTWIIFRTSNLESVQAMFQQIFHNFDIGTVWATIAGQWKMCGIIVFGYLVIYLPQRCSYRLKELFYSIPIYGKLIISVLVLWVIIQIQTNDIEPFIYYQF
ncbi:MAG: hypothetical protein Q4E55_03915, partial [Bacteroidales bacterium]|nr:hypothetical protein [Bacteroidales bacterium]